jgi:2-polyprenyl-3-methyl-5-hydroxy-6-metoxy-1,4-benzoquinol methylase
MSETWKGRLYQSYVSSGQAAVKDASSAESVFARQGPFLRYTIHNFLGPDRQVKIIDLGCGHGDFLYWLKQAGFRNIEGVDGSPEQIALAHHCGVQEAQLQTIDSYLAEAPSASCDVVLLFDVLEHLTREELFSTLDGVLRILRSGGRCIFHVPNAEGIHGMRSRYDDFTHEQSFTPRALRQVFTTVGFSRVECFEDKPRIHGLASCARRIIWEVGSLPHRLLLAAEAGEARFVLSNNMTAVAYE